MYRTTGFLFPSSVGLIITMVVFASLSCFNSKITDYKDFVVRDALASFSFEYPSFYINPSVDRSQSPHSLVISALGSAIEPGKGVEFLFISVFQADDSFPNAKAMLESELSRNKKGLPDFKLLEQSQTTVAELSGEFIIYSYGGFHVSIEAEQQTGTSYTAYFDTKGLIWKVNILADEHAVSQGKIDFEHILQTFKILN